MSDSSLNRAKNTIRRVKKGVSKLTIKISGTIGGLLGKNTDKLSRKTKKPEILLEINKVTREHRVVSIGDLHGNYGALLGNLTTSGIIDDKHNWIGGSSRVVFHGDIFADRHAGSIEIVIFLKTLRKQAELQGGEITVLALNHEDILFSYLTDEPVYYNGFQIGKMFLFEFPSIKEGIMELEKYIDPKVKFEEIIFIETKESLDKEKENFRKIQERWNEIEGEFKKIILPIKKNGAIENLNEDTIQQNMASEHIKYNKAKERLQKIQEKFDKAKEDWEKIVTEKKVQGKFNEIRVAYDRKNLLKRLRINNTGRELLEFMCNMELVKFIDDTLRIHVIPHPSMLGLIRDKGIDYTKKLYQRGMRYYLLGEGLMTLTEQLEFRNLRKVFLDTEHRKLELDTIYKEIKEMGNNFIISGHDTKKSGEITDIHGVKIIIVDFGLGILQYGNKEPGIKDRSQSGREMKKGIRLKKERRIFDRNTSTHIFGTDDTMSLGNGDEYLIKYENN